MHTFHGHILHGYYGQLKAALFATIERVLARCTGRIVVLCEQQQNEICSEFGIGKAQQFRVVPLGFEFDLAPPSAWSGLLRSEYRIAVDELLIGAFGRMCEVKNFGMLIRAFARLRRSAPDLRVRLVLVGDGQLRTELEQIAHEVCVSADVIFTGYRTDAMSLYDDIDIVALSSVNEGTPVTLLEGMSRGCPVVSTEVGGVASMMGIRQRDGDAFTTWEHGLTVPSGDEESLAAALEFIALRPQLRSQMGDAAQHSVLRKFSRERFIRGMEELYLELSNPVQADTCEIVANTAEVYTSSQ
jgi:glycosyltransferase involved in cell wall biosynthesis